MLGSEEGWPHGSQDLEGCRLTLQAHGCSAAAPVADSEHLYTLSPCSVFPFKAREGEGPSVRESGALGCHSLPYPLFKPRFHAELSPMLPHLAVPWVSGKLLLPLYLHVMSAAGAGGRGGAAGTAPRGIATWLLL